MKDASRRHKEGILLSLSLVLRASWLLAVRYTVITLFRHGNIFRQHLLSKNLLLEHCSSTKIFLGQIIQKTSCSSHFATYYTVTSHENGTYLKHLAWFVANGHSFLKHGNSVPGKNIPGTRVGGLSRALQQL